jgi:hypothetical protein
VNPITIRLGTGYTSSTLSTTRDYVIKLPATEKLGGTWLVGGHNVVIVGGAISIPANTPAGSAYDAQRTGIYIKGATGTVHVEGVTIEGAPGAQFDGVDIDAPQATVQLENDRVIGVQGGFSSFHGDVVQPWGGVADLRIDHLTATSNYQGLTLQQDLGPIGSAEVSNVDLTATAIAPVDGGGHMLWLTKDSNACAAYPIAFSNVYIQPRPGRTMANSVWPQMNAPAACPEVGSLLATWPALPFSGDVHAGAPAGGSFVPAGVTGLGYVSPGYAG